MVRLGPFSLGGAALNEVRAEIWTNMSMASNGNR